MNGVGSCEREEDRVAEPVGQQERGDRRDRDRRDDGDPQAADDRRHGQRQLDPQQHLPPRQPHPAGGLEHLGRRRAQPGDDVREEDHERVGDERDLDRRVVSPVNGTSSWKSARLGIV